ncbi:MAG TPA: phosphotransferase [Propionibacterium sp.]|nr:phosphotransferase [Propionibacterium sp.]
MTPAGTPTSVWARGTGAPGTRAPGTRTPGTHALEEALAEGVRVAGQNWRVTRAWPAAFGDPAAGYVLELIAADGRVRGAYLRDGQVEAGPDAALPALERLLGEGWTVLGHRFGKRAVLRRDGAGVFRKLASPKATKRALARADTVDRLLAFAPGAPLPPDRVASDAATGVIDLAPAPGRSLRDVLTDDGTSRAEAGAIGHTLGELLARLGRVGRAGQREDAPGAPLPEHGPAEEAAVIERWVAAACAAAPLSPEASARLRVAADTVIAQLHSLEDQCSNRDRGPGGRPFRAAGLVRQPLVLTHRDLHDGQILVAEDRALTVLDWDTAAWADPCLDVGNLLAHLELLSRQTPPATDRVAATITGVRASLTAAGHPAVTDPGRLALWRRAAAVRIRAVHAFRVVQNA